jgi:hypothetical protein
LVSGACGDRVRAMTRSTGRRYGCQKDSGGCEHVFLAANRADRYLLGVILPLADSPDVLDALRHESAEVRAEAK